MGGLTSLAVYIALLLAPPGHAAWNTARDRLATLRPDPAPAAVTNGVHYLTSNERRLDLFLPEVAAAGGVHLGVGSDQNYIIAGWSRPQLVMIVDFDQAVIDMHTIYGALFVAASTPKDFVGLWSSAGAAQARQAIREATAPGPRRRELLALYADTRGDVAKRTRVLTEKYDDLGIHWYLEDREQYRAIRRLALAGRIVAVRGDFTTDGVVREVGAALAATGLELGVLYLSNIEQYFMYKQPYRANMLGLPMSAATRVLRTLPGKPAGFQYMVQAGDNFQSWLRAKHTYSVYRVRGMRKGEHLHASEKFIIDALPPRR